MPVDLADAKITPALSYHEARVLRSSAVAEVKKIQNRMGKRSFRPAPGRLDANAERIKTIEAAIGKLDTALTVGIAEHKEAANGQS